MGWAVGVEGGKLFCCKTFRGLNALGQALQGSLLLPAPFLYDGAQVCLHVFMCTAVQIFVYMYISYKGPENKAGWQDRLVLGGHDDVRHCPSVRPSVCPSVCLTVCLGTAWASRLPNRPHQDHRR